MPGRETTLYHFAERFEQIVYSHEIGIDKPDPRAFEAACAGLEVQQQSCLFTDDFALDVEAAQTAEMQAHRPRAMPARSHASRLIWTHVPRLQRLG